MPTWEELQAKAGKYITQLLDEHETAPVRSGYNRLLGKAAMSNIKMVNEISQMLYGNDVIMFEDDNLPKMKVNSKPTK